MAAVASVRARHQLEVVEISEKEFRRALSDFAAIAAKIIRAFVLRRQWLESMAAVGEGSRAIECVHDFLGTYA
jgi:CRP-like cAMP-binding protein